ncbi:hypothetical protein F5Y05DRAFT_408299 [Hypoxylon sp. FL0543]|nr:hypothetical protein F5Y05DRAFT_408299 [Hypoxylon sp. FL0543]
MKSLGDINIETAANVDEVLDNIRGLDDCLKALPKGCLLEGWQETRLEANLRWISESREELNSAKGKFEGDSKTKKKIKRALKELGRVESKIQDIIDRSDRQK